MKNPKTKTFKLFTQESEQGVCFRVAGSITLLGLVT